MDGDNALIFIRVALLLGFVPGRGPMPDCSFLIYAVYSDLNGPAGTDLKFEIVLKVDMHCEACARKVARALKGFEGVEEVTADYKASKVVVKGKAADPVKVCQRIQRKSGKKVEIVSPLPKPPPENKQPEIKEEPKQDKKEEARLITRDPKPPAVVTIVLEVRMHCEACAQVLQKRIGKVKGVESVTTDFANDRVTVKGVLDPDKLVNDVYKKTDIKKFEYCPPKYYLEHAYAPQMFSDENPNACSVM
ncbi:hypothetical protein DH2020_041494 [Rehmannia glutinosa]|uniref:HMA domain-containing protein n=1 Tax=Rehmannia glutinosa TaxID=99300 RepID=A0ABR0UQ01_REHGL